MGSRWRRCSQLVAGSLNLGFSELLGFPGGSDGNESTCNAGDLGSIPGLGRSPGGGHGSPLQCSCLENPVDGGAWQATVHGITERQTGLSDSAQPSTAECDTGRPLLARRRPCCFSAGALKPLFAPGEKCQFSGGAWSQCPAAVSLSRPFLFKAAVAFG